MNAFVKSLYLFRAYCVKLCVCVYVRGWPSEKSYSSVADASHLIGKRGEPITANRSAPQAAGLFLSILDELESERKSQGKKKKQKESETEQKE